MSNQSSQIIILCEDTQQECFVRRFLFKTSGIEGKKLRVVKNPSGKGSREQFVRKEFPNQLIALRKRQAKTDLIVVIDADISNVSSIKSKLNSACLNLNIPQRNERERVAFIIPKRNIETWINYLDGKITNEESAYPKLQIEADCKAAVERLYKICSDNQNQADFPDSLLDACQEYKRIS